MSNTIINEVFNKAAFLKLVDLQVYAAEWEWYDNYVEELFEVVRKAYCETIAERSEQEASSIKSNKGRARGETGARSKDEGRARGGGGARGGSRTRVRGGVGNASKGSKE